MKKNWLMKIGYFFNFFKIMSKVFFIFLESGNEESPSIRVRFHKEMSSSDGSDSDEDNIYEVDFKVKQ